MLRILAIIAPSTAASTSASPNTRNGALPPSSIETRWRFSAAWATSFLPTAVEPVKETLRSRASAISAAETSWLDDVVTTSHTGEFSQALQGDDRLRKVSFTGSTAVGKVLVRQSADVLQRMSMELGGNAPFIVFEDADVAAAVDGAMIAKMRNMGEACTAANRFLVHEAVAREFGELLGRRMSGLRTGRGQDDGTDVGPLINADAVESVGRLVTDAVHDGAQVLCGGSAPEGDGYFYAPTVLLGVPPQARINSEEIFGPVAPITTFASDDEAIRLANATEYGLASYVYTRDLARTIRVAEALEFGMVGVNTGLVSNPAAPFGGVKASGFGREGGFEGIEEYLDTTYVAIPV
jgi:succinate-semialdehyde dehydrogenase/glutarate-semialdehyde dehydrogenase